MKRLSLLLALLLPLSAAAEMEVLDRIVAVVNDGVIMESELEERVDETIQQLRAEGQRAPGRDVLRGQVLERMITDEIQLQKARRAGIRVDDGSLNQALSGIARQNGMNLEEFAAAVRQDGLDWSRFRDQVRREMKMGQLQQRMVGQRVRVTDREVERFLDSEAGRTMFEAEYRLAHILVGLPDGASPDEVEEAEAKATHIAHQARLGGNFRELAVAHSDAPEALQGGYLGWRQPAQLPSLFAEAVRELEPGEVSEPLRAANGYHLLLLIDRVGGGEQKVEQRRVRHVLIEPDALRTPEEAEEAIVSLHRKVREGELSFAEAAREHSDDPGSARRDGDLGWVGRGEMVPEFEETMFATEPGEISEVFRTDFGWHFLKVEDERTADKSREFRRMQARNALQHRRFDEELQQWIREIRAEAYVEKRL